MAKIIKTIVIVCCALSSAIFIARAAKASETHLVINEVYSAPTSGEKEWLELYNPTNNDIDLGDYALFDGSLTIKNLNGTIEAGDYYVYEASSGWLNNSGETIALVYLPTSKIIDQITYGNWNGDQENKPKAPTVDKTIARLPNGIDTDDDLSDFSLMLPTKNAENIRLEYTKDIVINEILPKPVNGTENEFIELKNLSDTEIDLSGWQIDDIEGGSTPYTISAGTTIGAQGFLVFFHGETGIYLNDSGDSARLLDPNGELKYTISYDKIEVGVSYSRFDDAWRFSQSVTPADENIYSSKENDFDANKITSVKEAKILDNGQFVKLEGFVTAPPGTISSQYFYMQDESGGIQVYSYSKTFPSLESGIKVTVYGELSEYAGEKRLKISSDNDIKIIQEQKNIIPQKMKIFEINLSHTGEIVSVEGIISKTQGNTFYIKDDTSEIKVIIRESTGIKKPKMRKNDSFAVSGVVSSYRGELRILPYYQDGVKILTSGLLPEGGFKRTNTWNLSQIVSKKPLNLPQIYPPLLLVVMYCAYGAISVAVKLRSSNL